VLAHESSHLHARHDLVIEAFTALWIAFPRVVRSRVAVEQIRALLEMAADDEAVRIVGKVPMARALVILATGSPSPSAPGQVLPPLGDELAAHGTSQVLHRVERLIGRSGTRASRPMLAAATYAAAAGIVVVPTVTVALPWLRAAWRIVG
jgi:Zn-dependent protease with chaperone function